MFASPERFFILAEAVDEERCYSPVELPATYIHDLLRDLVNTNAGCDYLCLIVLADNLLTGTTSQRVFSGAKYAHNVLIKILSTCN